MYFWCETFILKDMHESSLSKERLPEKNAVSVVRWDVDRFNVSVIILSLFS